MDTYGHLFPGQEAEAALSMAELLVDPQVTGDVELATGTNDRIIPIPDPRQSQAQRQAQRARRELRQRNSTQCNTKPGMKLASFPQNSEKTRASCDPAPPGTMPCNAIAPLAQSAEQLTLNQ